ncbi:naked cuticle-like protein 3 isoform X1 [Micropterus salmoides]|uniref:protein naked cuticle homolog 2-like isoform X1 n=1 Tax=Micropterus salmoides TaxID=27706 RepID=UPI0018EA55E1|nr:protein naked cuticle homolog 2-like isoform X1 [Micropterus salmoides]XP_038581860.1 naked cuticle-like protein 3 isoform X1 [Micropterus salmoides]
MGKFQSKLASKRRQSPEGGSLASNVQTCQTELERFHIHKTKLTENLYVEVRKNQSDLNGNLKVVLPPKKTPDRGKSNHFQVNKQTKKRNSHAGVNDCTMGLDEDTQQEWVFTLYNFNSSGNVIKEDISSLMHSMYEVLEASLEQPCGGTAPLKIKLVVTASADPVKTSQIVEKEQSASQEPGTPVRRLYCMDENMERRNHYLDLAGIENYTSKFDNTESPSQEPREDTPQHHPVVNIENCISPEPPRGLSNPHFLKRKAMSVGKDRNAGQRRSCRLHGQHPASWCHPSSPQPQAQRTHSRRLRSRALEASSHIRPTQGGDRELPTSNLQPSCGAQASPAQRHQLFWRFGGEMPLSRSLNHLI